MAHQLRQLQTTTNHDTIAHMQILTLIISSVALILSGYALYRSSSKHDAQPPTVGTKGAGGGGW